MKPSSQQVLGKAASSSCCPLRTASCTSSWSSAVFIAFLFLILHFLLSTEPSHDVGGGRGDGGGGGGRGGRGGRGGGGLGDGGGGRRAADVAMAAAAAGVAAAG